MHLLFSMNKSEFPFYVALGFKKLQFKNFLNIDFFL